MAESDVETLVSHRIMPFPLGEILKREGSVKTSKILPRIWHKGDRLTGGSAWAYSPCTNLALSLPFLFLGKAARQILYFRF